MSYKIFLDDIRIPTDIYPKTKNEDWMIIRNLPDFKHAIQTLGIPDYISFDNDLGGNMEEGKDAAKWMVYEKWLDISEMDFLVHSANSSGVREYVECLLNNWKKELKNNKIMKNQITTLTQILNALEFKDDVLNAGGEIYAVGGIVRDAIMKKQSDDLDIVIRGIPYKNLFSILSKYGRATDTSIETIEGGEKKDFGATKFVSKNSEFNQLLLDNGIRKDIDIMLPRKDSKELGGKGHRSIKSDVNPDFTIYDDLKRRDITINAIALDLNGNIIDNGHALNDIVNGIIRAVSEESFIEDPVRMIRAIRFMATFNYKWDDTTLNLIKENAHLLSDKDELPTERFLMEFQKMIGKSDLGRAVKLLVELGLYKAMFGIESSITNFEKFENAKSVAEFSYILFENEPKNIIIALVTNNITKVGEDIKYITALIKYISQLKGKKMDDVAKITELANIYNISSNMLLNSFYTDDEDREIANKFKNGTLPKDTHDIKFKGEEFVNFIVNKVEAKEGIFDKKTDFSKMGKAKNLIIKAVYGGIILNETEAIKKYLNDNLEFWIK